MKQTEVRHLPKCDPLAVFSNLVILNYYQESIYQESSLKNHYEQLLFFYFLKIFTYLFFEQLLFKQV